MRRAAVVLLLCAAGPLGAAGFSPRELYERWPHERVVPTVAPCLRHAELVERLRDLAARSHGSLSLERVGESVQGRAIHLATLGEGPRRILLWSQMHGDEPSATPALVDLASYLLAHRDEPEARAILGELTLLMVPMLNPDGAEIYSRRNAQGIDVNRDALALATPEGALLKRLRDRFEPVLGFNLHDQNRRRTVGDSGVLAVGAVLAVTGDRAKTVTPGRQLAMRAGAAVAAAIEPFAPGGVARFDDSYSPRSFGDNLTAWGTPVLLIESGGLPLGRSLDELTRLNFVALLATLGEFAEGRLALRDPAAYEALPENEIDLWADVAVRGGRIRQPGSPAPFRADLAFDLLQSDRLAEGCPGPAARRRSEIAEIGDARFIGAAQAVDAAGGLVLAPFTVAVEGLAARRWLGAAALERLAGLGIARVAWRVAGRDLAEAQVHARAQRRPGRPEIEVETGGSAGEEVGALVLARPPAQPATSHLSEVWHVLAAVARPAPRTPSAALERLWVAPAANGEPPLRVDGPASFLIVRPDEAAPDELGRARLEAVWLDGVAVERRP